VREALKKRLAMILVDEFQDTDPLQYEIVLYLGERPGACARDPYAADLEPGRLFIVGDPKQSIYGFRNADVGIFHDARAAIVADTLASGGPADGGAIVLAESFRPLPEIAAFVNLLFSGLLRRGASRHEVDYDEIIVGRSDRSAGSVELLLVPGDAGGERGAGVREECAMVARRLNEAAAGGRGYGECAVLLRDRTNLPVLEKAFEEEGVPYLLAGGVGFFQTQEVYDFLNYLRFLVSPGDDTALAGILRSPFFSLTDADLFAISAIPTGPGESFWEKLGAAAVAGGGPGGSARAFETLRAHRSIADRVSVPRLLRRIAADTGWFGVMAGLSHGPQRRENFLKLLDLARRRGSAGPFTLYDFMSYLDHRAEEEEREGQASTAATGSAVRVMTVHAAKGLEFPLVVLPFLDRAQRPESEPIVDTEFGIGFRVSGDEEQPPLYACLRALSEEKRLAEEKRIFYVACTRARDVLVLSGNERMKAGTPAPLDWLMAAAQAADVRETGSRLDFGPVRLKVRDAAFSAAGYREVAVPLSLPVRRTVAAGARHAGMTGPGQPDAPALRPRILTGPLADTVGGESYSATMLKTYLECPAQYYLTYVLGLAGPERDGEGSGRGEQETWDTEEAWEEGNERASTGTIAAPAALEGELAHQVLSGLSAVDGDRAVAALVDAAIASHATAAGSPGVRDRVSETVLAFSRSAAGREILSRPGARTEFQISASLGDAVVMGKIDRLYKRPDGLVEFVDYKTDAVSPAGASARAEVHRHQMALYALLISRLYRQPTVRGTVLFLKAGPASVSFDFGEKDFDRLGQTILDAIAAIRAGVFSPPKTPCAGCPGAGGRCPVIPPHP
jgi:ATP-dependent helicase/nuclease subunit A